MRGIRHISVIALAVTALSLGSCTKEASVPVPQAPVLKEGESLASFRVTHPVDRMSVSGSGDGIASLDLLVFRSSDGLLAARERATDETEISVAVTSGSPMDWYVIANAPSGTFSPFSDKASFLAALTSLDQTGTTMVMHASGTTTFTPSTGTVDATLYRYASKVTVRDISVPWLESFATAPTCSVAAVGLVNVVGTTPWSSTPTAGSSWYNRSSFDATLSSDMKEMLFWEGSVTVTPGSAATVGKSFYAMPNPLSGGDYGSPWSARGTRIALELLIGGAANWYTIDLPAMEGNRHYVVNEVVIRGPGATAPDQPLDRSLVTFGVDILDWGSETKEAEFGT